MKWPSADDVVGAHDRVLAATGGAPGLRDPGLLESALARPLASFEGKPLYPDLLHRVAALIEAIIRNHPFVDGNKRTAMLVGVSILATNGFDVTAQPDAIESIAVSVANREIGLSELSSWLARTSMPAGPRR